MEKETQVLVVGEPGPGMQSYWAECIFCDNSICIYAPETDADRLAAESIMEDEYSWWYVDGGWLCPPCQ